jgi:T5orf172 domain.
MKQKFVYFIKGGDSVKIGMANDVRRRLNDLQVGSPIELQLIGIMLGGRTVELRLHERFKAHRLNGEWFRLSPELEQFIDDVASPNLQCGFEFTAPTLVNAFDKTLDKLAEQFGQRITHVISTFSTVTMLLHKLRLSAGTSENPVLPHLDNIDLRRELRRCVDDLIGCDWRESDYLLTLAEDPATKSNLQTKVTQLLGRHTLRDFRIQISDPELPLSNWVS